MSETEVNSCIQGSLPNGRKPTLGELVSFDCRVEIEQHPQVVFGDGVATESNWVGSLQEASRATTKKLHAWLAW